MVSPQKISSYLRKPYELDAEAEQDLRSLISDTPYFANAWLLLARSLHNQQSPLFDDALKQASMFAGDRKLLYALVNLADKQTAAEPLHTFATDAPPATPPVTMQKVPVARFEETIHEPQSEHEKVASAYEDIFGTPSGKNETISTEFETFEIEPPVVTDDIHTEEDFELELGEHLDGDHDGVIAPAPGEKRTEEAFELEIADHLADNYTSATHTPAEEHSEEEFELNIGEHLEDEEHLAPINHQDENPLGGGAVYTQETSALEAPGTEIPEEPVMMAEEFYVETAPVAEETEVPATADETENIEIAEQTLNEPIAFKLGTKETATTPVSPAAETHTQPAETEKEPANFYEWLEQLKGKGGHTEKKNDITGHTPFIPGQKVTTEPAVAESQPADTKTVDATTLPPPTAKPNVEDIISRFINLNPTISRPKAEFYNPVIKAKDSDTERDDLATETLAKIYLKQNLTEKAIATYEKLKTLHPEKAAYFQSAIDEAKRK